MECDKGVLRARFWLIVTTSNYWPCLGGLVLEATLVQAPVDYEKGLLLIMFQGIMTRSIMWPSIIELGDDRTL